MQKITQIGLLLLLVSIHFTDLSAQNSSVARRWNEVMLEAIREDLARPPVQARNLFHVSMAMWDAWAVYDTLTADTYLLGKTVGTYSCQFVGIPAPADRAAARREAICYAAYRVLSRRFQNSPNALASIQRFRNLMGELGYDWTFNSNFYQAGNPAAMGNYIGDCVTFYGLTDGANETGNYSNINYVPVNPPLSPDSVGNPTKLDPNRWQPLRLEGAVDQQGNPIPALQNFQSPEWGKVVPFALADSQKTIYQRNGIDWNVYCDPGPPAFLDTIDGGAQTEAYIWNHSLTSIWTGHLNPEDPVIWDISPANMGNTAPFPTNFQEYQDFYHLDGTGPSLGRSLNPKTGQPYVPQLVPRGDYTRVLAQFWADGPNSETPPGHWFSILNKTMEHPEFVRKYNGNGPVLDTLEYDLKAYFTLGGAVHDAAIAAWSVKGWYDGTRPITALRWMADKGQSSSTLLPNYHPAGIQLIPGWIEQVALGDPLIGLNEEHLGKIKLFTWQGFDSIANAVDDIAGVGWILAENWWPFQRKTFVTPPFAGYISGHSTFSRAAAEALTLLTGDEYFPGGISNYQIGANSGFLGVEKGPSVDVILQWATYRDASDQTSLSRIWGSIHPPEDDIPGRIIGAKVGTAAFYHAKEYFYKNDVDQDGYDNSVDCDDHNAAINPSALEICDGFDNNCDGMIDEGFSINTYYADADGDGFGDEMVFVSTCGTFPPTGYVATSLDCADWDATIYIGAPELCDGLDNDCNGEADDGLTFTIFYEDADGDGYGTSMSKAAFCTPDPPGGFVANDLDCDDNDPDTNPDMPEICDQIDNNCGGEIDEELPGVVYFVDADGDGFGNPADTLRSCLGVIPVGFVGNALDCDDDNADVNPDGSEGGSADGLDNDCNGLVDDFVGTRDVWAQVRIYPNPVTDYLSVSVGQSLEQASVTVVHSSGRVYATIALDFVNGEAILPVSEFPAGLYWLRVLAPSGAGFWVTRFVKL